MRLIVLCRFSTAHVARLDTTRLDTTRHGSSAGPFPPQIVPPGRGRGRLRERAVTYFCTRRKQHLRNPHMDRTHITTMENIDAMVFVFVLLAGMLKKWNMLAAALLWLLPAWLPCRSRDFVTLSGQSVAGRLPTSPFSIGSAAWNLERGGTRKSSHFRYQIPCFRGGNAKKAS